MASGGARAGAGRPKKSLGSVGLTPLEIQQVARRYGETPLEYMLRVMNDPEAAVDRRDRMAMACASFCHARIVDNRIGKTAEKKAQAAEASAGKFEPPAPPKSANDDLTLRNAA